VEIDKRVKKFPMGAEAINELNLRQLVKRQPILPLAWKS
jgi:hypothetical protein